MSKSVNRVDVIMDFKIQAMKQKNMGRATESILIYGVKKQMLKAQGEISDANFTMMELNLKILKKKNRFSKKKNIMKCHSFNGWHFFIGRD